MKIFLIGLFAIVFSTTFSQSNLEWELHQKGNETRYKVGGIGTVQEILFKNGVLPDPFYGLNEEKYLWIEDEDWIFESKFTLTKEQLKQEFIYLHFGNIDTYATIYVNDQEIGNSASYFMPYRFNVKEFVKVGNNTIRLHFVSPVNYHKEEYKALKVKFPTPNDVNDSIKVASMTRKPQFQFGWDWSLRMNTIGLNELAYIETYSINKLLQSSVQTIRIEKDQAVLQLDLVFEQPIQSPIAIDNKHIQLDSVHYGRTDAIVFFTIKDPQLYWPKGWGEQAMYESKLVVYQGDKIISSNDDFYFGISTKELVQQLDQYGTSFEIHWNGKLLFCKGGNYVPQDVFLSSVDEGRMAEVIDACAAANFNMIRVWGGGYYLPDFFYRYCAKKGILIWQDFMFACALYPGDDTFLSLVKQELDYQIPRISSHPNIAIFNGNNEVMVASKYWGFKLKYGIDDKTQEKFDLNYNRLFKSLMPELIHKWTTVPYIHTSPLSHWGKDEWYRSGTQHYWGVWHGNDPLEDFARKSGRFNAEYGFQSFPEYSTLLSVSDTSDWNFNSAVIKQHQKSDVGNAMILKQTKKLFGQPRSFEDFIYLSQLTQAEAIGLAVASHRLQFPRCTGTIYWQVNDCWPVSSWSSIDYFGNWKALHYRLKDDFEPITVLRNLNADNTFDYWLTNEAPDAVYTELRYRVFELSGVEIFNRPIELWVKLSSKKNIQLIMPSKLKKKTPYLIEFEWTANDKTIKRSFVHNEKYYTRSTQPIEIISLKHVANEKVALTLNVKEFAAYVWVSSKKGNVFMEKNFNHLLPGEHTFILHYKGEMPLKEELIIKSL